MKSRLTEEEIAILDKKIEKLEPKVHKAKLSRTPGRSNKRTA